MRQKVLVIGIISSVILALVGVLFGAVGSFSDLMPVAFIIAGVILVIVVDWYIADLFREIAKMKGHSSKEYFWVCFWFGAVGYLAVIALPDRSDVKTHSVATDELPNL